MNKPKRNYSQRTIKILFALSGNQCAHPDCENPVIVSATEESDELVLSQICHIYALSEDGPRGKAGLTEKERNEPENLILLCPTHHVIVDGQHESYPAKMLKKWKQAHEQKMEVQKKISTTLESVRPDVFSHPYFPTTIIDQKIEDEVNTVRKSRFFVEYDSVRSSLILAKKLIDRELSGGTATVRSRAIAWCVRFLSHSKELGRAKEYLNFARELATNIEIEIAYAFICSNKSDKKAALSTLATINTPLSRSAALFIISHHDGAEKAIAWLESAGIEPSHLDSDGKYILLTKHLELGNWEASQECLKAINDEDLLDTPALNHTVAITHLLKTVPNEFCSIVLQQVPFNAKGFPLASNSKAINALKAAHKYFVKAAELAQQLNCHKAAKIDEEYALWLELRDTDQPERGRQRLAEKLREPKSDLRLVHLDLKFGIKLDLEAVERKIERQITLHGELTYDAAVARFALAFTHNKPEDAANYIAQHYDGLAKYYDKKSLQFLRIELLSQARLPERAKECLDILKGEGLSDAEENHLQRLISEAEGIDPVEARTKQYNRSNSLGDLVSLVDALEARSDWNALCEYAQILFDRTQSLHTAELLAKALSNMQRSKKLIQFFSTNRALLKQSNILQLIYCWSLYNEGELLMARNEFKNLSDFRDNTNYRSLLVNLAISTGDWVSLSAFVANEFLDKDKRSAQDLIGAAQLAIQLGSPHAKELIFTAAEKGEDDAGILAAAYFLATNAGWEDKKEVFRWMQKAAELSGDEGPIYRMTLKEMVNLKPQWDRKESEIWQLLSCGNIPIFFAAESLNKSLIDLILFPALANQSINDPRRRGIVPAFSGKRQPVQLDTSGVVGIDASTLLVLSFLNLLDKSLDAFDTIYVPHSTLGWLFAEKKKASFHQPSRISDAYKVRHYLSIDTLSKLNPSTNPDSDLSAIVGDELAQLIAEAEKVRDSNTTQRIVVRSSPVHQIGSLMQEEADLRQHANVLVSCQAVANKLRQLGQITAEEEKKALNYLQIHEKRWRGEPEITDGAYLYLDDLTVTYFLHLGILEKLKPSGFKPIISLKAVNETNELISYGGISEKVNDVIEHIRSAINARIETGKIKVDRRHNIDTPEEHSISEHPSTGIIALAAKCDAIMADDRFINQHLHANHKSEQALIFSTLDLIDVLVSNHTITPDERLEHRTRLRRAGFFFIPIEYDELAHHLNSSMVKDGKVIETAELKAIRENLLRVRMSSWLQLPQEAPWFHNSFKVLTQVMKDLWNSGTNYSDLEERSDWILDQLDIRSWAHCFGTERGDHIVKSGRGPHILIALMPPVDAHPEVKKKYLSWIEDRILTDIKEQYPELYSWLVEWCREEVTKMADTNLNQG